MDFACSQHGPNATASRRSLAFASEFWQESVRFFLLEINAKTSEESIEMARRNEGLSGNELAAIVGITANRRSDWARKGLLRQASSYGPLDAIDLACLGALVDKVGPKSARRCWPKIREALRDQVPNRRTRLWAVIDERPAAVQLVDSPSRAVAAASSAPGSISVLAIHEIADRVLSAYRQATPGAEEESGGLVHDLASMRRKSASS